MNAIMVCRAWKDIRRTTFWFAIGAAIYVLAIIAFYPSIRDNSVDFDELLDAYPQTLMEAFGIDDFSTFAGFVGAEALNVIWPLIVSGFAITVGSASVAGEIERGSVDLWLSVPVTRWRLLLSKVVAASIGVFAIVIATVFALGAGAMAVGEWPGLDAMLATLMTLPGMGIIVLGYSVLLSTLLGRRGAAAGAASGITLLAYLAWIVASMNERFEWLRYLSMFSAYDVQSALSDAAINWAGSLVLVLLGAASVAVALWHFQRRDAVV